MSLKHIFENTEIAFKLKSNTQLQRAYFLFKMMSNESLVKIGSWVAKSAFKIKLPITSIVRSTVFDHFCGGITESDCLPVVESLYKAQVFSVLDYSVEGKEEEAQFDATMKKVIALTRFAENNPAMPFSVFKPTGLGRFEIWQKQTEKVTLSHEEQAEWERIKRRYHAICNVAKECNVALLIDAEETWIQTAADDLCQQMMEQYNTEKPVVFNTLQCYRWDRIDYLKKQHLLAKTKGYKLGFKVVRGAYMEKENDRAENLHYKTPICVNKEQTDNTFNTAIRYVLDHLSDISLFMGTHNEQSSYFAMDFMKEKELSPNDTRVWFGQLYGMSDHISYNLANLGYNVAKYIPFGPVKEVMPYLIRRAEENTSVAGQTSRELNLLKKEKKRRGI